MNGSVQILHFNDVYHISDVSLVTRFHATLEQLREQHEGETLVVFSGDAYSPSLEASVLRGEHMTGLLNALRIDVACFGNHDFDFGEERLRELAARNNFPWTLTNAMHAPGFDNWYAHESTASTANNSSQESLRLASARPFITKNVAGVKFGFFGLAGTDWPSNCQHLPGDCIISAPVQVARHMARQLRVREKCAIVIAITHMRLPEDIDLSQSTDQVSDAEERVDLILGGHDHDVLCRLSGESDGDPTHILQGRRLSDEAFQGKRLRAQGQVRIVKSGMDWTGLSAIKLSIESAAISTKPRVTNTSLSQYTDLKRDPVISPVSATSPIPSILSTIQAKISKIVQQPLWHTQVSLDGRSRVVRSQETALGNMLADAVRVYYGVDIAFVNGGGIRCNRVIPPTSDFGIEQDNAPLCVKDVIDIVPFDQPFVIKRVRGSTLRAALENSVSDAHTDGRFLHPSGLRLCADWSRPEGQRVLQVQVAGRSTAVSKARDESTSGDRVDIISESVVAPLDEQEMYEVAMVSFIANGFDGYTCFTDDTCELVVGEEGAMTDTSLLLEALGHTEEPQKSTEKQRPDVRIEKARQAICSDHAPDGLRCVNPTLDGRIELLNASGRGV